MTATTATANINRRKLIWGNRMAPTRRRRALHDPPMLRSHRSSHDTAARLPGTPPTIEFVESTDARDHPDSGLAKFPGKIYLQPDFTPSQKFRRFTCGPDTHASWP